MDFIQTKNENKTGEPDCNDASDEENCLSTTLLECPEGEFRCGGNFNHISAAPGSRCILNRFRCDGKLNPNKLNVDFFFSLAIWTILLIQVYSFFFSGENDCPGN